MRNFAVQHRRLKFKELADAVHDAALMAGVVQQCIDLFPSPVLLMGIAADGASAIKNVRLIDFLHAVAVSQVVTYSGCLALCPERCVRIRSVRESPSGEFC
jgi:hypothetical protein